MCGFTKGVSGCFVLVKNEILEYNLPYVETDFTCNPGPILLGLKKLDVFDIESHLLNFNQSECTSSDLGFFIKLADGQFLA